MDIIAFNRHWVIYWRWLLLTLIVVTVLIGLAVWQWQRAVYKETLIQRLAQLQQAGAIPAQQLQGLTADVADGARLAEPAHWLAPYVWLLDNQVLQGQVGYDVIVPMQLDATHEILLTNLGWVAAPMSRTQLPTINLPIQFNLQGVLRTHFSAIKLGKNIEENGRWPMRIQRIDIKELSAILPRSLYSGMIYQQQHSPYIIHYQPVVMTAERHRAYALQWGLLAVAVVIVALAAGFKKEPLKESVNENQ